MKDLKTRLDGTLNDYPGHPLTLVLLCKRGRHRSQAIAKFALELLQGMKDRVSSVVGPTVLTSEPKPACGLCDACLFVSKNKYPGRDAKLDEAVAVYCSDSA